MTLRHDPFNRVTRVPEAALAPADRKRTDDDDRALRVAMLSRASRALLDGQLPDSEARLFLAGAICAWLENGGDLARDYLGITSRRGSKLTAQAIWKAMRDDASSR